MTIGSSVDLQHKMNTTANVPSKLASRNTFKHNIVSVERQNLFINERYVCLSVCPLCIQPLLNGFEQSWALNDHHKACQAIVNFLEGCIANFFVDLVLLLYSCC